VLSLSRIWGFYILTSLASQVWVCDFQELYRYLIDDFVIQYCQNLVKRDFTFKTENMSAPKKGKREYLKDDETKDFTAKLNNYFERCARFALRKNRFSPR